MARSWRKWNDWNRKKKWKKDWKKNSDNDNNNNDNHNDNNDNDNGGGGGFGDYHNGGWALTKLMLQCQKSVSNTLKWGKFSDSSVDKALNIIKSYSSKIDAKISKWTKPDTEAVNVTVKAAAAATGSSAEANSHVKLGIFDADDVKLVIGTAESYAATGDRHGDTYVNSFAGVKGVDTGSIVSYYAKGQNYEKAVECLIAIDWEKVYDKNWVFTKHHGFYSRAKKQVGDGQTIKASTDVYVEADSNAQVDQATKALAYDDMIKSISEAEATAT